MPGVDTVGRQALRTGLWLLLIGLPVLYCLLFIAVGIYRLAPPPSDIYIGGEPVELSTGPDRAWPYYLWMAVALYGPRLLTGLVVGAAGLLALSRLPLLRQARRPDSPWRLAAELLVVLLLAYGLGALAQVLSVRWFGSGFPMLPENYWWPWEGWPVPHLMAKGWTIYAPTPLVWPEDNAASIKLGALLAALVARSVWRRRSPAAPRIPGQSA